MSYNNNISEQKSDSFVDSLVKRITGAATLITLGLFFLLNSTDVIPWSSWLTVFLIFVRIWPVFIIIAGLQLMFNKSNFIRITLDICSSLVFVVVLLIAAYVNISNSTLKAEIEKNIPIIEMLKNNIEPPDYTQDSLSSSSSEFSINSIKQREINLDFTSEEFYMDTNNSVRDYLTLDANYYSNISEPYLDSSMSENTLVINSGAKYLSRSNIFTFNPSPKYYYTIGEVQLPTSINLKMTSGNGELDLSGMNIERLSVKETSGNFLADLSSTNIKSLEFEMTSGNSTINFSKDSYIQISYNKTSGNLEFNNEPASTREGLISLGDINSDAVVVVDLKLTSGNMKINTK